MEQIVSSLLPAMPAFANGRYVILGTSMGAWVGYELCQKLSNLKIRLPEALLVCASSSPHNKVEEYKFANLRGAALLSELSRLSPELIGAPESAELVEMMLPVLEADFGLCERWQPDLRSKLTLPIFGFSGDKDTFVTRSEMERWSLATEDKYELNDISGTHFFVDDPPAALYARLAEIFGDLPSRRYVR